MSASIHSTGWWMACFARIGFRHCRKERKCLSFCEKPNINAVRWYTLYTKKLIIFRHKNHKRGAVMTLSDEGWNFGVLGYLPRYSTKSSTSFDKNSLNTLSRYTPTLSVSGDLEVYTLKWNNRILLGALGSI